MPNAYDNQASADAFAEFIESEDGKIQRQVLYDNIVPYLANPQARILDAACGQGWLAAKLSDQFAHIEAFDSSRGLIAKAKQLYPKINFQVADATTDLPYADNEFDAVILNMAAHDMNDLVGAFKNLHRALKPGGTFIMTMANPYYSFPVGVWKRGLIGRLLNKKPHLKVRPYHSFARQAGKLHQWDGNMSSYFHPLSEYITQALAAGFSLRAFRDLQLDHDSPSYNAQYRLYRFPIILLLAFEKSVE
jgi:SAM-dependent methyltransferase